MQSVAIPLGEGWTLRVLNTFFHCTADDELQQQPSLRRSATAPALLPASLSALQDAEEPDSTPSAKGEEEDRGSCSTKPDLEGGGSWSSTESEEAAERMSAARGQLRSGSYTESEDTLERISVERCNSMTGTTTKKIPAPIIPSRGMTTVMLRNLPNGVTRGYLLELINVEGFAGRYDFLYFPIDFFTHQALGYAFVNLVSEEDAEALRKNFEGFSQWAFHSSKVCRVSWSQPLQGLKAHLERYRNSPLMHPSVPDEYRPVLFKAGVRTAFPLSTKKVKPPRRGRQRMLV